MEEIQGLSRRHCYLRLLNHFAYVSWFLLFAHASLFPQDTVVVRPRFDEKTENRQGIVSFREVRRPRIGLVLSGGGARGVAHVGVLRALERHHIPIDLIVGTSIGSLVGGLYASGYSTDQLKLVVDTTNWAEVLSFADESERTNLFVAQKEMADREMLSIRFNGLTPVIPSSFSSAQRLTTFINQLTLQGIYHPHPSFDDLKIPFRAVATDLISGKRVILSSGPLAEALRATITIPLLYSPIRRDSAELTDGGLLSNIPVEVAKDLGMDIIIAVDISSPLRTKDQLRAPWEVADQIIGIMAQLANKQSLEKATIVVKPDLGNHTAADFTDLDTLMLRGEEAMDSLVPALQDSIKRKQEEEYRSGGEQVDTNVAIKSVSILGSRLPDSLETSLKALAGPGKVSLAVIRQKVDSVYAVGTYKDVRAEIVRNDSTATVRFVLSENPDIRGVELSGNVLVSSDDLLPVLNRLTGKPANAETTRATLGDVLALYRDRGYSLARVRTVRLDSSSGILQIGIDEGVIWHMTIEGTTTSRDWVLWRELPFNVGDVFTVSGAQRAIANLMATNLFEQVLLDVRYIDDRIEIVINATEKKSEVVGLGLRMDNERGIQPSVAVRDENFLGTATELGANFAGGLRNRDLMGEFKANRIFNSYYTFDLNGYADLRDIYTYGNDPTIQSPTSFKRIRLGEYRQIKNGAAFSLGTQVERLGNVAAEYRLELNEINFLNGTGYSTDRFTLQTLRLSSTIDSQDEYPFATSGSLMNLSWETASSIAAGDIGYSKIFVSYEWFSTYFKQHTIHPKITFGYGDKTLPLSQQFTLGGEDSFYGLLDDDSRGRQIFVVNLEYRALLPYKLFWDTYFKVRYDFGSIWPQPENISLRALHHGVGVGLAVDTPAGKASVSVGRSFFVRRDLLTQPLSLGPVIGYLSFGYPL